MKPVQCVNGDWFDADKYSVCPLCGGSVNSQQNKVEKEEKKIWSSLFGKKKKDEIDKIDTQEMDVFHDPTEPEKDNNFENDDLPTEGMYLEPDDKKHTFDKYSGNSSVNIDIKGYEKYLKNEEESFEYKDISSTSHEDNSNSQSEETDKENNEDSGLSDMIKNISANSEGKTMSYFNITSKDMENNKEKKGDIDPVVGWLVCIGGNHFGESFCIYSGRNSIGRNRENRIVLMFDNAISRIKHAFIIYDPRKKNYHIQPGDGSGLTYLNGDSVFETVPLSKKDIIEIGESKFIFVPLCGDYIDWEDYINKGI